MSGTSLDGIDLTQLQFHISPDNKWTFKILKGETIAYPSIWKNKLKEAISFSEEELTILNENYTHYLAKVINSFIQKHALTNLDAVCSHGHTILHKPDESITLQIGNLPKLANLINQRVVCDFRVQDVALGGQGAPLVPIGDRLLFNDFDCCLNLGGFANISSEVNGKRIAYDICEVNIVLNYLAEKLGFLYDDCGNLAKNGKLDKELETKLNELKYYNENPPKSLGLEWVKEYVFPILEASPTSIEDKLRTVTEHIAFQIAKQISINASVLITGGGAYNIFLISRIQFYKKLHIINASSILIDYKEALVFGLLGVLKLRKEINCLASVTGAKRNHSSGIIFLP